MSFFDDLTLGEVEMITTHALKGVPMGEADPLMLAGGVMWATQRKENPGLTWDDFKNNVKMSEVKEFSTQMQAAEVDPQKVQSVPLN